MYQNYVKVIPAFRVFTGGSFVPLDGFLPPFLRAFLATGILRRVYFFEKKSAPRLHVGASGGGN